MTHLRTENPRVGGSIPSPDTADRQKNSLLGDRCAASTESKASAISSAAGTRQVHGAQVVDLRAFAARRDQLEAEQRCGIGRLSGPPRLCNGAIMVPTALDDEALELVPSEARYLAAWLLLLADIAEGEVSL